MLAIAAHFSAFVFVIVLHSTPPDDALGVPILDDGADGAVGANGGT